VLVENKMTPVMNWNKYSPFFRKEEFDCKCGTCGGKNLMTQEFMDALYKIRLEVNSPFGITSGFRCQKHPMESVKSEPGQHQLGIAADVKCTANLAHRIVKAAMSAGFTGIGISQNKRGPRFIHLDRRTGTPVVYSY
jgi:zinc D-Ala-D-Ala carboxypeptidase